MLELIATQLAACTLELSKLPPLNTTDPVACVYSLITQLCASLKESVAGSPVNADLVQTNRDTYEDFMFAIRASAPPFAPYKDVDEAPHDISEYVRIDPDVAPPKNGEGVMFLEDVRNTLRKSVTMLP